MSTAEFLAQLRRAGVELRLEGERLLCSAPKGALTPQIQADLKTRKAEILKFLEQGQTRGGSSLFQPPLKPVARQKEMPLSPLQQVLWFAQQLDPETPAYNAYSALRLQGLLDPGALERSVSKILERHEILRTIFITVDDQPRQKILPAQPFTLWVTDLQEYAAAEQETQVQQLAKQESQYPFDLSRGPLFRARLLQLGPEDYIFLFTIHHIISDAWSLGVFFQELGALYQAFLAGRPNPLPPLAIQYADYAHWQQTRLNDVLDAQLDYWRQQFNSPTPALQLPGNKTRLSLQTRRGALRKFKLSPALTEALKKMSRQQNVTLFMLLLAAFKTLLNRYTGQKDILVCTPVAGRNRVEIEELIGYFNNILPLRSDLSGDPTLETLLSRVRQAVLEAYAHQEVPFPVIAQLPNLTRVPLSRAMFILQDYLGRSLELEGITVNEMQLDNETADFDLTLIMEETNAQLVGLIRYKTDLFDAEAIAQMADNLTALLEHFVNCPEQKLSALPLFKRNALARSLAPANNGFHPPSSAITAASAGSHDDLELRLIKIWEQVLGIRPIGPGDNFFELGGHSLLAAQLFAKIEQQFVGQKLPLALLLQAPTVEQLARALRTRGWTSSWSSLVPIQPHGTKPPLFFVHAHGGNVLGYRDLSRQLDANQPFYGLQAPKMDTAKVDIYQIPDMAAHYIKEIQSLQPEGPYFLGGYCLGGIIALEMARQLQTQNQKVALVAMVQSDGPEYPQYLSEATALRRAVYKIIDRADLEISNFLEVELNYKPAYIQERVGRIIRQIQAQLEKFLTIGLAGFGLKLPHSKAYLFDQVAQAHQKAYAAYQPQPYQGSVVLFAAQKQPLGIYSDPTLGWGKLIGDNLEVCAVPGHHLGMLSLPRVQIVAKYLQASIDRKLGLG